MIKQKQKEALFRASIRDSFPEQGITSQRLYGTTPLGFCQLVVIHTKTRGWTVGESNPSGITD